MRGLAYIFVLLFAAGCMDQDPLNLSQRKVSGPYRLERFDSGTCYYLQKGGGERGGVGCLEGTVEQIGWTNGLIFAKRHACFRGDPDGWMIIDVSKQSMSGPLSEADFRGKYPDVQTLPPEEAWKRL